MSTKSLNFLEILEKKKKGKEVNKVDLSKPFPLIPKASVEGHLACCNQGDGPGFEA